MMVLVLSWRIRILDYKHDVILGFRDTWNDIVGGWHG